MTVRKSQQLFSMLFIMALVAVNASPVLAADSENISVDVTSDNSVDATSNISVDAAGASSVDEAGNSSMNATCQFTNPEGLTNSTPPDNQTLATLVCFSKVSGKSNLAVAAKTSGFCTGDGRGLMEIHAPAGSSWAAFGPWGWFHGTDANGDPNFMPTDSDGSTCIIVDVCGSTGGQWGILVRLPDGSYSDSGIFDFSTYPADPGKNAACYKLFEVTSGSTLHIPASFGSAASNPHYPFFKDPINLVTGNYFHQHQDQFIPGRGLPLSIDRYYNSLDSSNGPFGTGWTFNYNMNLTVITDRGNVLVTREDGRVDTYTPNPDGTYTPPPGVFDTLTRNADGSYTLEMKNHIRYTFAPAGQLTEIVDTNGNTISLTYIGNSLTGVSDSSGRELTFTYDAAGRIISIADPIGRTLSYSYDDNGNLIRFTDTMGGEFSYTYDDNHRMTSITNPKGIQIVQNTYDGDGRVISQSNALAAETGFSYDADNQMTTVTDPLGRKTVYTYDDRGWTLSETDDLGNTISYAYENGNRISATDANGNTLRFTYDAAGNVIQAVDPLGQSSTLDYDSDNNLVSGTNALGRQVIFSYDANNNLFTVTNPSGSVTTFAYDQYGQLISGRDANGHDTSLAYDNNGNPTAITDALGNRFTFSYDGVGRLTGTTDARGSTGTFSYDALDRLVTVVDPSGYSASFSYDNIGNQIGTTDALGRTTSYSYGPTGQLIQVTDATGGIVNYAYDTVDNMVSMTDANGHTTHYTYDPLNRLATVTDPLGRVAGNSYDAVGNAISITDNNGNTTGFTYDALNRLTGITYADTTSVSYTYDAIGNRVSMTDSAGTTSYVYDGMNRLTSVDNPGGQTVTYGYDAVGNTIRMTYPEGKTVSYAYNDLNRISGVTDWTGNVTRYAYDANSNLAATTYPNGVRTEYSYDNNNRLITQVNKGAHGMVSSYEYTLDAVGNRIQVRDKYDYEFSKELREQGLDEPYAGLTDASKTKDKESKGGMSFITTYAYDNLNRLNKVTYPFGNSVAYTYDPMGNRLRMVTKLGKMSSTTSYNYDAGDQLLRAGRTTYTYDNNGNRITKSEPGVTTSYGYDAANRLSTITLSQSAGYRVSGSDDSIKEKDEDASRDSVKERDTGASRDSLNGKSQTTVLRFTYDGDGIRTGKSVTRRNKTESAQFLWDINMGLPQILTESDGKGTALYTYGLDRIAMMDPRGGPIYYQYDGLGSVRSLSDRRGTIRAMYSYDAFGKPLLTPGRADNDFMFTGEQMDAETGLIYLRARYYDPETGRFITKDPFTGFNTVPQSLNRYTYVQNNPVRYADPSGKLGWGALVPGAIGAGVNAGWYYGVDVVLGGEEFSWVKFGGRLAGGFTAPYVGIGVGLVTKNPIAIGSAIGETSYVVDRAFAQPALLAVGVQGTRDDITPVGAGVSLVGGGASGKFTNNIIPFSDKNSIADRFLQANIFRSSMSAINSGINTFYDSAINSNQGPVRLGRGSLVLPGNKA